MALSRRQSLRFNPASFDVFEERILLSAIPAHHHLPHDAVPLHATRHAIVTPVASTLATAPGYAHTFLYKLSTPAPRAVSSSAASSRVFHSTGHSKSSPSPLASGQSVPGISPAQIRHIYSLDQISNLGSGQTIAIVDAYDDPNIFNDSNTFDQQFMTTLGGSYYSAYGDASSWLVKTSPSGSTPPGDTGWGQEISLDVEWMHAIAPKATIVLVEAASNSYNDLLTADSFAAAYKGVTVISNSWGSGEFSGETSFDSYFQKSGVTFVFSAGDAGNQSYPAVSPYVVSVGGTHLTHDSSSNWASESGWYYGGGGVSRYEAKPGYQKGLSYPKRANPDVAYDADPYTGFAVYDSYGGYGWGQYGGTSAGAPQWSAIIALANQGRQALTTTPKLVLDGSTQQTQKAIYAMTTGTTGNEQLYDVTSGRNRVGSAGPGFDLVTGRGTPRRGDLVYQALVNY